MTRERRIEDHLSELRRNENEWVEAAKRWALESAKVREATLAIRDELLEWVPELELRGCDLHPLLVIYGFDAVLNGVLEMAKRKPDVRNSTHYLNYLKCVIRDSFDDAE